MNATIGVTLRPTWLSLLTAVVCATGCSDGDRLPATYAVSGRVFLDGSPVAGAQLSFVSISHGSMARPAHGRTDAEGTFNLKTYFSPSRDMPGAIADNYAVVIAKLAPPATINYGGVKPPINLLPSRYADPERSGLAADVVASGRNDFEFRLQSD